MRWDHIATLIAGIFLGVLFAVILRPEGWQLNACSAFAGCA